jgi:hypothetical protein
MKILNHVDLGKAFEDLKKTLIEVEKETQENSPTILDSGIKYASAYGRLSGAVQCHICANTDTEFGFIREALKTPGDAATEAPTLLLQSDNKL